MKWNNYDYSYLRPPASVFLLKHTRIHPNLMNFNMKCFSIAEYIHNGKFKNAFRKIWYGDDKNYVQEEVQKINEIRALIQQEKAKIPA